LDKKYTQKDYLKIAIIASIIAVPLVVAYGAAGYFDENGTKFWSEWDCEQMTKFATTSDFKKITEAQNRLYALDMGPCLDEP
jgi:thymidylate synthase